MGQFEFAHHVDAFGRSQVDDVETFFSQPDAAALGVDGVADNDLLEAELKDEAGAIPAGRKRGDQNQIAEVRLAASGAERVRFAVQGRVAVLHQTIAARADERAVGAKNGAPDGDAAFFQSDASLLKRYSEHARRVQGSVHDAGSLAPPKRLTQPDGASRLGASF